MFDKIIAFFKSGEAGPPLSDRGEVERIYTRKRWEVFLSITIGYGFYYVCRLGLSVAKKPMLDAGVMDTIQMGILGSALLFFYAFGKFTNGFLADRSNIKKFLPTGLSCSAVMNLILGMGLFWLFAIYYQGTPMCSDSTFLLVFWGFVALWALNGWFQSMGAAPCIVSLSQWFSNRERGTYYGIWFISHNIGEGMTFIGTAALIQFLGWWYGFLGPAVICSIAAIAMYIFMSDRPQTYGLPAIADYKNDHAEGAKTGLTIKEAQLQVLKNPAIWILGLSSASMYISRYAVNNWAVLFLQESKQYSIIEAGSIIAAASVVGVLGSISCGFISDRFFHSRRNVPNLIFSLIVIASLCTFYYTPQGHPLIDTMAMAFFGFGISATVIFLGGLIAVDISPKQATGAAMGLIGIFSYMGAAAQDLVSGYLVNAGKSVVEGKAVYDFRMAIYFWIGASVLSTVLALTVWNVRHRD